MEFFWKIINSLQQMSEKSKSRVAFLVSLVIMAFIVSGWVFINNSKNAEPEFTGEKEGYVSEDLGYSAMDSLKAEVVKIGDIIKSIRQFKTEELK